MFCFEFRSIYFFDFIKNQAVNLVFDVYFNTEKNIGTTMGDVSLKQILDFEDKNYTKA